MATEKTNTLAQTHLDGSITDSATTLMVVSATKFPTTGTFRITVDDEIMIVSAVSGMTFTVSRGDEGSDAVAHTDGANVNLVMTQGSIQKLYDDRVGVSSYSSRGSAEMQRIHTPTDSPQIAFDNGTAWQSAFGFYNVSPVLVSDYTFQNQGSATATQHGGSILLFTSASDTAFTPRALVKALPGSHYQVTVGLRPQTIEPCGFGLLIWNSSNDKLGLVNIFAYLGAPNINYEYWPNFSTYGNEVHGNEKMLTSGIWYVRITNDGTDRKFWLSCDGLNFTTWYSEASSSTLTGEDYYGVFARRTNLDARFGEMGGHFVHADAITIP